MTDTKPSLSQVLGELKKDYLQLLPQKISDIENLLSQKIRPWPEINTRFHNLKGTGKTYGFAEVSILCEPLEHICEQIEKQLIAEDLALDLITQGMHLLQQLTLNYQNNTPIDLTQNSVAIKLINHLQQSKNNS